jgi:mannose-6-phosphate isomerase
MEPLVFEPYLRPVVWGGRKLRDVLGKSLPTDAAYGESWELSPHPQHVSRVSEGPLAGQNLNDLCRTRPAEIFGEDATSPTPFPLLIKFLDCRELLSIQVHPDDRLAQELAGEDFGKTEAWVVLQAEPGAKIYSGFLPGVSREDVAQHLAAGTLEEALHSFTPQPGDCLFLPAGTVHAVGGGVLMAEVQQASDATFRLHDWNRLGTDGKPRELHIQQALTAIDWDAGPASPVVTALVDDSLPGNAAEPLVNCPQFAMHRIHLTSTLECEDREGAEVWLVLDGIAELRTATGYARSFQIGETVLIPASTEAATWVPDSATATLLRVRVPSVK